MSGKTTQFHVLAEKRIANLLDQIRIFSNLSNLAYDWTPVEIWDYFDQITVALEEALGRFQKTKRWPTSEITIDPAEEPLVEEEIAEPEDAGAAKQLRRKQSIHDVIVAAQNDKEMLPEMVVLQREVINDLQRQIDELRGIKPLS
jgi:hypothetical protein